MIIYLDRSEVPDVEDIAPEVLRWLVTKAEQACGRYQTLEDYYRGQHPSLRGHGGDEVRVAVNYARYVVDTTVGYYLGEGVKYDPNERRMDENGSKIDLRPVLRCFDEQNISEVDLELGRQMGTFGDCLELCYAGSALWPKSACLDPRCAILVCDASVEHNKLFAVVWERRERVNGEKFYALTVYTDRTIRHYRGGDLRTAPLSQVGETQLHLFGEVPVIAYENNALRQGDFEQIIPLMDAYNTLMSDRLTDKRKFVDALLVFFGMSLREGDEGRLAREKFLDGAPLDARAEYIQKTFDEAGVQVLADALVREMHKMTMTVDMSDEKFAGNASGQALRFKLLTMGLMVRNKMRRMEKGLRERLRLYSRWLSVMGGMEVVDGRDVDVVFTVNLPVDEQSVLEAVTRLQGIVDEQTLLSQLWFIRDPAEALENVRRERAEKAGKGPETSDKSAEMAE